MPIRVLCVDDNEWIGESIERRLRGLPEFEWLGWLPTTRGVDERLLSAGPAVVLLDLDIPGDDPFGAIVRLRHDRPAARVLVLSGHVRADYLDKAFAAGAWGYLSKGDDNAAILDAVRRVSGGEFVVGPDCAEEWRRHGP